MPNAQMVQKFAMDLNGTGTLVDITSYVRGTDGVQKTGVRQDQFRDSVAATYTFVLENYDGRFTPGNPNSPYAATPTERMTVNWSSGGLLREGSILTLVPADDNWTLLTITCDDMLGAASRNDLANLAYSQVIGSNPYAFWPMNDAVGSGQAAEATGNANPVSTGSLIPIFGVAGPLSTGETQATFGASAGGVFASQPKPTVGQAVSAGTIAYLGAQITANQLTATGTLQLAFAFSLNFLLAPFSLTVSYNGGSPIVSAQLNGGTPVTTPLVVGASSYYSAGFTVSGSTVTTTLYVNGVSVGSSTFTSVLTPGITNGLTMTITSTLQGTDTVSVGHVSVAPVLIHEEFASITTEANRYVAIDQTTSQITLATLPTDLSTAPIGYAATSGKSALDAFNELNKTEQGYLDCVTTGTFTAPTQAIRVRARDRPATADAAHTFDAQLELVDPGGSPEVIPFVRDSTNLIWSDQITGANGTSQTVSQQALQLRAGSNNSSDTINTFVPSDLFEFGSDRLWRGSNIALRPSTVTIDNLTCPTDRSPDFNAMVPGDRIRITNIPNGVLGFTTWDGLLLDKDEDHRSGAAATDKFTLYLAPAPPATGIFDTDLFEDGSNNLLTTAMTIGTVSAIVGSVDGVTWFEQTATGYYIQIDSEVMKVTAAAAPSGGNQTLTVTRAQNTTTAATHAIGAAPEVVDNSSDITNNAIFAF